MRYLAESPIVWDVCVTAQMTFIILGENRFASEVEHQMDLICGGLLVLILVGSLIGWLARQSKLATADPVTLRQSYPEEYARKRGLDFEERPFMRGWSGDGMDFIEKSRGWHYKFVADSAQELNEITRRFKEGLPDIVDNPPIEKHAVDELFDSVQPKGSLRA